MFFHGTDKVDKMNGSDETSLSLWTPVLINNKPPQLCFEALINRKRVENHVNKFYRTEPIEIRLGENLVRLKNGETCRLIGDLYDPKACVPYDIKIKFRRGIPQNWSDIVHGWAKMLETDQLEILALSNYTQKKRLWTILKSLGFLKVSAKGRIIFPTWKYCTGDEVKINNLLCNPASGNICIPKLIHRLEKELLLKSGSKDSLSKDSSIKTSIFDSKQLSNTSINTELISDNSRVTSMQLSSESSLRRTRRMHHSQLEKNLNIGRYSSAKMKPKNADWIDNMKCSPTSISLREKKQYSNVNRRERSLCCEKSVTHTIETRTAKRESNLRRTRRINPNKLEKNLNISRYSSAKMQPKNSDWIDDMKYSPRSISVREKTQYSNVNRREQSLCCEKSVTYTIETRTTNRFRTELQTLNTGCKVLNKVHKSRASKMNNPKNSNHKNKKFMVKSTAENKVVFKCKIKSTGLEPLHQSTKNAVELMKSANTVVTRKCDGEVKHVPQNIRSKFRERKMNRLFRFSKQITKENNENNGKKSSNGKKVTDFTSRKTSKYTQYQPRKCDAKNTSISIGSRLYRDRKTGKNFESKRQIQSNDRLSGNQNKAEKRTSVQLKKLKTNKISQLQDKVENKVRAQKIKSSNASPLKRKSKDNVNEGISTMLSDRDEGYMNRKSSMQLSDSKKKRMFNVAEREFVDLSAGLVGPPKTLSDRKKLRQSISRLSSSFIQPMDLFSDPHYHHLIEDAENASNQEWDSDYLIALDQIKNGSQADQLSVGSATPPQKYIIDSIMNEPQIIRGTSPFDNSSPNQEEVVRYIHRQMKQKNKLSKEKNSRTKLCSLQLPSLDDENAQELSEMAYNAMLSGKNMPRKLFDLKYRRRSDSDSSDISEY